MKLALLDLVVCPRCGGDLAAFPFLSRRSEIVEGVLRCASCKGAYPIHAAIPELLPPSSRTPTSCATSWPAGRTGAGRPAALVRKLFSVRRRWFVWTHRDVVAAARAGEAGRGGGEAGTANGATGGPDYKKAEVRLTRRKDLPGGFFNPGLAEPFVSFQPSRSIEKILRFMIPVQHAGWRYGDLILDLGVGYAWTTEWLGKLGFHPVGVDLNRDYLRVGMRRTGGKLPRASRRRYGEPSAPAGDVPRRPVLRRVPSYRRPGSRLERMRRRPRPGGIARHGRTGGEARDRSRLRPGHGRVRDPGEGDLRARVPRLGRRSGIRRGEEVPL